MATLCVASAGLLPLACRSICTATRSRPRRSIPDQHVRCPRTQPHSPRCGRARVRSAVAGGCPGDRHFGLPVPRPVAVPRRCRCRPGRSASPARVQCQDTRAPSGRVRAGNAGDPVSTMILILGGQLRACNSMRLTRFATSPDFSARASRPSLPHRTHRIRHVSMSAAHPIVIRPRARRAPDLSISTTRAHLDFQSQPRDQGVGVRYRIRRGVPSLPLASKLGCERRSSVKVRRASSMPRICTEPKQGISP